ncbi:gamma-glutamylcyclotransferase [Chryseobacterium sp. CH21]|nr:gamma-glutamylcyclotransferase [Chryseobacterium sp. CH21]
MLNRRKDIADITLKALDQYNLSIEEQYFLTRYQPENRLIIYGTLAPGKPNHHKMTHIKGDWKPAILKGGKLETKGWGAELGFNGYVPTEENEQADIPCYVLFSDNLNENWDFLDGFEGEGYKRILANYELEDGQQGIGYLYAINE